MKRKFIWLAVFILIIMAAAKGVYMYNKPHESITDKKPFVTLNADELYTQYNENEAVANRKYVDKIVEVKGTVDEVKTVNGVQVILLNAHAQMGSVICRMASGDNTKIPAKNDSIMIKGKCTGFLMDVNLTDCMVDK